MDQINLLKVDDRMTSLGQAKIAYKNVASIMTKPTGFMDSYDFSLNPYSGCSFGCTYCYAAFFTRNKEKMDNWGYWVDVKENALEQMKKKRKRPIVGGVVYMSSVTDPYQPIERKLEITRKLLEEFAEYHQIRLVVQTRSPLVTRDIDLFKRIGRVQVNMTITTDDENVRKVFEPYCPSNNVRMKAIQEVHDSGVQSCITMTPLLPVQDAHQFAKDLKSTGIDYFIVQPFHKNKGKFVAGTRDIAIQIFNEHDWTDEKYKEVQKVFMEYIPDIGEGKQGFSPPI